MSTHDVVVGQRLRAAFAAPRAAKAALIPYLTGGHPDVDASHRLVAELVAAGADIVELGVPFSDPIADGPIVQRSTHEALERGVTPDDVFAIVAAHSAKTPFVLLTYLNTVLAYGLERFFARAATAGVDGLVVPDLPLVEALGSTPSAMLAPTASSTDVVAPAPASPITALATLAATHGVALIPMAAPTSSSAHLDLIAASDPAFVYCVAVTGVTGARREVGAELPDLVGQLRARTAAPLAVGFGISTPSQAAYVATLADGVIVGSALIDVVLKSADLDAGCRAAGELVRAMSDAIASGSASASGSAIASGGGARAASAATKQPG